MAKSKAIAPATPAGVNFDVLHTVMQGNGNARVSAGDGKPLVDAGYIQVNTGDVDAGGNALSIITAAGIEALKAAGKLTAPATTFAIFALPPKPEAEKRIRGSQYPFDNMQVNDGIWLAVTAARPNPAKSMSSLVNVARKRYAVPVKDDAGNPIMETVTVKGRKQKNGTVTVDRTESRAKMTYPRAFRMEAVAAGVQVKDTAGNVVHTGPGAVFRRTK